MNKMKLKKFKLIIAHFDKKIMKGLYRLKKSPTINT